MINWRRAKCDGANSFFFDRKNKQPEKEEKGSETGHGAGHVAVINSSKIIVDHDDKEGEARKGEGRRTTTKVARKHDKTNPTQIDFLLESPSPCVTRTLATLLTAASSFPPA